MTDESKPAAIVSKVRLVACPTCRRSTRYDVSNPDRPFCSPRCKTADIAAWADEGFKIPGPSADPEDDEGVPPARSLRDFTARDSDDDEDD